MTLKRYESLDITKQFRSKKIRQALTRPHRGYDTETLDGYLRMICDSEGDTLVITGDDHVENSMAILNWLTKRSRRESMNWFFNITYDARAIIKWLPKENHEELYYARKTKFGGFTISHNPNKDLTIVLGKNKTSYFDIMQFYPSGGGLGVLGEKHLGMGKIDTIDTRRLGSEAGYWDEVGYDAIRHYCVRDCVITRDLAVKFYRLLWETLNFAPMTPISTGKIAEVYYQSRAYIPKAHGIPVPVQRLAWNSFYGGRIETIQRGHFPKVWGLDISSAYPHKMYDLMDYSQAGTWEMVDDSSMSGEGVYDVTIRWDDHRLGVVPQHSDIGLIYPVGEFRCTINEKEYAFIRKYGEILEVHQGFEYTPDIEKYPFRSVIEELYTLKQTSEDKDRKMIYKLFLNSIYGKTCQAIRGAGQQRYRTGQLWNPVYCSRITSLTRLQLLEKIWDDRDHLIGFATDAVYLDKPMSGTGNGLGDWDLEVDGKEAIFLYSGVRWIDGISKVRGYGRMLDDENELIPIDLHSLIMAHPDESQIPIRTSSPQSLYRSLRDDNLNVFEEEVKMINVGGDVRREWDDVFHTFGDVWGRRIMSAPIETI